MTASEPETEKKQDRNEKVILAFSAILHAFNGTFHIGLLSLLIEVICTQHIYINAPAEWQHSSEMAVSNRCPQNGYSDWELGR
jgi:hypothetical protein